MEFLDGAARLFDSRHLDKSESFGTLSVFVTDDLGISDLADSVKEFEQIAFCGIEGKIADIQLRRGNFHEFRFAADFFFRSTVLTRLLARFRRGCFRPVEESNKPLPEGEFRFRT